MLEKTAVKVYNYTCGGDFVDRTRTCFFTGHRKLPSDKKEKIRQSIKQNIEKLIVSYDVRNFISGGALGFDTMAAEAVTELKMLYPHIKLYMYIPCRNQDVLWSQDDKKKYEDMLSVSDEVLYISDKPYSKDCMNKRNLKMIEDAFFCIAFCINSRSGTGFTVRNAVEAHKQVFNIADELYN